MGSPPVPQPTQPPPRAQPEPAAGPPNPAARQPGRAGGGGITLVGVVSLLAIIALILGIAWTGNRVWPVSARIDSAWRDAGGNAEELTKFLRGQGYTCTDETEMTEQHFHRMCANFTDTDKMAIEMTGPVGGEIMRVHIQPHGQLSQAGIEAATRAIDLSVPDAEGQRDVRAALTAGEAGARDVDGPWGRALWVDGTFNVVRTWTGPIIGSSLTGDLATVSAKAAEAGYRCTETGQSLQCQRMANGAAWELTVRESSAPGYLRDVTLRGRVTDAKQLDPAGEFSTFMPSSRAVDRVKWFVSTADQRTGQAGFAGNVRVAYIVRPDVVTIHAGTPCSLHDGVVSC
ncbi:MAG: hypothetical protein Q4G46_01330 [Propionibacteriaceae bacterium]|nr:hypothetical protein [Propionibacteriaceae bacterium]